MSKGLVLITGPAGSGKSTTLACIINEINKTQEKHIITLEDPIEFLHRHQKSIVSQREVKVDTKSYVVALRASLRQSPDVILLGEMRDYETIDVTMTAAETGHLVFSTLHTIGAANTIDRIIDVFPASQQRQIAVQLSMVLQAIVTQQLVPDINGELIPVFEIMTVTPAIRNMIRDHKIPQIDGILYASNKPDMISTDMSLLNLYKEGKITKEEAVSRIDAKALDQLLHPNFDQAALKAALPIGEALPASPGAAAGKVYFDAEMAKLHHEAGLKVILVRLETSPEDIEGMHAAEGILTARGGMTSHAAVVARGMGTACVAGCGDIKFAEDGKSFTLGGKTVQEGDYISLDGSTGKIYLGEIRTVPASISGNFDRIMTWADEIRTLQVRTNADTPADALNAVKFGAQGIGLCRTEHMFFDAERIPKIRRMILSTTKEAREIALNQLIPYQKKDFKDLYEVMEGRPVTIRFLDPPLHEFLPNTMEEITALAKDMGVTVEEINMRRAALHEFNPMMGHRGCRLAVTYPEIAKMQTRAVMEAAIEVKQEKGYDIVPEIMIPLVGEKKELAYVKEVVVQTAEKVKAYYESDIKYKVGTMIEIPRAALLADEIAEEAEFFSFGTNDLTQMTFGFSRDDAGKFLESYYENKIYESDPFAKLDQKGVGQLIEMAAKKGKATRPDIHLGICGEHGGDPSSVEFCYRAGLDYVSCSPFRVPIARLAAAQAVLKDK